MVWFTFTFLLGLCGGNEGKNESGFKGKKENSQVEKNYMEIEVTKPNFSCHIEYILFPNQIPKFIDVVCWDGAAKIYFESSTSAIIPLTTKQLRWIHFRVNHKMKLTSQDIPIFHLHNVKFTITLGNKKFGEVAKSDKPKKFYGPKFTNASDQYLIKKQLFQPLSETVEDLQSVSFYKEHLTPQQQLYISLDTTLETSEYYNKLIKTLYNLSNEYHDKNHIREPTPQFQELPPLNSILGSKVNNEAIKSGKGNTKKADVKNREPEKIEFSITGEEFLSGRKTFENCLKYNSEEIPYIVCLCGVKNLLSKPQAKFYNPLTITLSHLNNMPADQLKNNGITKLKFRFLICNEFLAESNLIPIKNKMKLKYTRTVLTHGIDKHQLIYFIQTGGLKIDVLGNFPENATERNIREQGFADARPNRLPLGGSSIMNKNTEFVLLGRVSVDISSIIIQPHKVLLKYNFETPVDDILFDRENIAGVTSVNELNFYSWKRTLGFSHYPNAFSPVLTVVAGLGHPITGICQAIATNSQLYTRLLAVFYNTNLAIPIIQMIQSEVNEFLGIVDYIRNGTNIRRPLTLYQNGSLHNFDSLKKNKMTGFIIDCVDRILIYAESSVFGGVQGIWASTSTVNPSQGHVLYDSELIFPDRLYENLFKFGGFMAISLKQAPEVTLSKPESYSKKNIPEPAWKALKCINLLVDCKSIKAATQSKLFPDFNSLGSVAIEFGAPIRICEKRERNYN